MLKVLILSRAQIQRIIRENKEFTKLELDIQVRLSEIGHNVTQSIMYFKKIVQIFDVLTFLNFGTLFKISLLSFT